jgi:hypothetical protein
MLIDAQSDPRTNCPPAGGEGAACQATPRTAVQVLRQARAHTKGSRKLLHVQGFGRPGVITGATFPVSGRSPEVPGADPLGQSAEGGRISANSLDDSEVSALIKFLQILDRWDREASQKGSSQTAA